VHGAHSRSRGGRHGHRKDERDGGEVGERVVSLEEVEGTNEGISIDDKFSDGRPLIELVDLLLLGEVDPLKNDFLMLQCTIVEGRLRTADNKRLACLREWAKRINRPVDIRVDVTAAYDEKSYVSAFLNHYTTGTGDLPRVRARDGRSHYPEAEDRVLERRTKLERSDKPIGQAPADHERGKGYRSKGKRDRDAEGPNDRAGFRSGKGRKGKKGKGRGKGSARDNGREDGVYLDGDQYDKDSRAGLDDTLSPKFSEDFVDSRGAHDVAGDAG